MIPLSAYHTIAPPYVAFPLMNVNLLMVTFAYCIVNIPPVLFALIIAPSHPVKVKSLIIV